MSVWGLIRALFVIAVGLALWLIPSVMLGLVIALFASFWIITGVATIAANFAAATDEALDVTDV